jgi:hypothetical protein
MFALALAVGQTACDEKQGLFMLWKNAEAYRPRELLRLQTQLCLDKSNDRISNRTDNYVGAVRANQRSHIYECARMPVIRLDWRGQLT